MLTPEEEAYRDYILPLPAGTTASSWLNILMETPVCPEETAYSVYYGSLVPQKKEESSYRIFSNLYDQTFLEKHKEYVASFKEIRWPLAEYCNKKKQ